MIAGLLQDRRRIEYGRMGLRRNLVGDADTFVVESVGAVHQPNIGSARFHVGKGRPDVCAENESVLQFTP